MVLSKRLICCDVGFIPKSHVNTVSGTDNSNISISVIFNSNM